MGTVNEKQKTVIFLIDSMNDFADAVARIIR